MFYRKMQISATLFVVALYMSNTAAITTTQVWERQDAYSGNRSVWDPSVMGYTSIDHNEVYQLDAAPFRIHTDRDEIWMPNYRCMHTNLDDQLGWNRTYLQSHTDFLYGANYPSWCQRYEFNPWFQPANYYPSNNRWWTQATAATWYVHQNWSNGTPVNFAIIRLTENKSITGTDGVLRRGSPPLDMWGYTNWKMDNTPVDPWSVSSNALTDGYYQGFITLSLLPMNAANNWGANSLATDYGPIVWPKRGYRQWRTDLGPPPNQGAAWQQTSLGCRHPQGFTWNGYLYLYYLSEPGVAPTGGRDSDASGGIFVARSPINSGLLPGTWQCGSNFNVSCLPAGYSTTSRTAWENALSLPGPNVAPILSVANYPGITSFAVSAIANTSPQKFVGIAETYNSFYGGQGSIKLFRSTDLVNWTYVSTPYTYTGPFNQPGMIHYPRAIRSSNGDPETVDASSFFIVGGNSGQTCQSWNCEVNRITVTNFY